MSIAIGQPGDAAVVACAGVFVDNRLGIVAWLMWRRPPGDLARQTW
jgi:hypothetical protein